MKGNKKSLFFLGNISANAARNECINASLKIVMCKNSKHTNVCSVEIVTLNIIRQHETVAPILR